jgi:histidinol-phosphate aminotransferase
MPSPRSAVADSALVRPDWTCGHARDPRRRWLDKNENGDPEMAGLITRIIADLPAHTLISYAEPTALYHKLAAHLDVAANNLLFAAGSDGAIRAAFEAFIEPGDVVLHTAPTFAMYPVYCRMYGARAVTVDYRQSALGPVLSAGTVVEAISLHRPKLVCLPNPDSPTGTVFTAPELHDIIRAAGVIDALVLIDEAYHPFHPHTVVPWIRDYPHLMVTRSTGKAWGLAGLRIGYAVTSHRIATLLHKVRPMYEVSTIAAAVFERLLDHADVMAASVERLMTGKAVFLEAMAGLSLPTIAGHGNFAHVAFGEAAPRIHEALEGIATYRRDFAEPCLKGFSRFSATTPELFQPVIEAIVRAAGGAGSTGSNRGESR